MNSLKIIVIFLAVLSVNQVCAEVTNNSDTDVYLKSEFDDSLIRLEPGEVYKHYHDAVIANGKVYKTSNLDDLIVEENGDINIIQKNIFTGSIKKFPAQNIYTAPDREWRKAFEKAAEQLKKEAN